MPEFRPWPKIARLFREVIITEKIDGTNAAIGVTETGEVYAQSRSKIITPEADNFGFARWVAENDEAIRDWFGPGLHFGEWYGSGIQRGYGLPKGQRRLALFHVDRWSEKAQFNALVGVDTVPVLYRGPFDTAKVREVLEDLRTHGSYISPFMDPEGIVVYHTASNESYKVTLVGDEYRKQERTA
jgi:hypothetical protein